MSQIMEINNLIVKYGSVTALENINLNVNEREFLGIIGPNGGGKTTLLKTLLGLIKPDKGSITVFGQSHHKQLHNIGYVPQYTSFDDSYPISVEDVVKMGGFYNKPQSINNINRVLESVDALELKHKLIGELSGGQKQRILIARALISQPKILLLDEPTASIDTKTGKSVYSLLKRINETATIILVSHDVGAVSSYVSKIACLNKKLVFHDTKELTKEMIEETYQCPIDLIAHGVPHRVLKDHN